MKENIKKIHKEREEILDSMVEILGNCDMRYYQYINQIEQLTEYLKELRERELDELTLSSEKGDKFKAKDTRDALDKVYEGEYKKGN